MVDLSTLDSYKQFVNALNSDRIDSMDEVFSEDVVFKDPFHEIHGLSELKVYYESLYENAISIQFEFFEDVVGVNDVAVPWRMNCQHRKIKNGQSIELDGLSTLHFSGDRVAVQCDYFDAGALLYEHLPALGWIVRKIKTNL